MASRAFLRGVTLQRPLVVVRSHFQRASVCAADVDARASFPTAQGRRCLTTAIYFHNTLAAAQPPPHSSALSAFACPQTAPAIGVTTAACYTGSTPALLYTGPAPGTRAPQPNQACASQRSRHAGAHSSSEKARRGRLPARAACARAMGSGGGPTLAAPWREPRTQAASQSPLFTPAASCVSARPACPGCCRPASAPTARPSHPMLGGTRSRSAPRSAAARARRRRPRRRRRQ